MKRLLTLLPILGLLVASTPAIAATARVFREPDGAVTVYDLEPGARVRFGVDAAPDRALSSNECGLLVVNVTRNYPRSAVQVNGEVINPNGLPQQIQPACRRRSGGSYELDEARTHHFINASTDNLVVVTNRPNTRFTVTYPGLYRTTSRQVNNCGFLRIRETSTINFNDFLLLPTTTRRSLAEFRIADLVTLNGLLCSKGYLYYPSDWQGFPEAEAIAGSEIDTDTVGDARAIASPSGQLLAGVPMPGDGGDGGVSGDGEAGSGSGDNASSGDSSGSGSSGSGSGGSTGDSGSSTGDSGSTPTPSMSDFTPETYNPSQHDYNGDGLVDDADGDGVPDDQDGDGFPDGPWRPNDLPNSAGPGLTLPPNVSVCYGYDGSVVASSYIFVRGQTYHFEVDGFSPRRHGTDSVASLGAAGGKAIARFQHPSGQRYDDPFFHYFDDSKTRGLITDMDYEQEYAFYMANVKSCLIPPWMN